MIGLCDHRTTTKMAGRRASKRKVEIPIAESPGHKKKKCLEEDEISDCNSESLIAPKKKRGRPKTRAHQVLKPLAAAPSPDKLLPTTVPISTNTGKGRAKRLGVGGAHKVCSTKLPAPPPRTSILVEEMRKIRAKCDEIQNEKEDEESIVDSTDRFSEGAMDLTKNTMDGDDDYLTRQNASASDKSEQEDEDAMDEADMNHSKIRLVEQNTSVFDDPSKSHEDWWIEDPTREPTLCQLWQETRYLYDFTARGHQEEDRAQTLRRFATVLQVPREYINSEHSIIFN